MILSWPPPKLPQLQISLDWNGAIREPVTAGDPVSNLQLNMQYAQTHGSTLEKGKRPFTLEFGAGGWTSKKIVLATDISGVAHFGLAATVQRCWNSIAADAKDPLENAVTAARAFAQATHEPSVWPATPPCLHPHVNALVAVIIQYKGLNDVSPRETAHMLDCLNSAAASEQSPLYRFFLRWKHELFDWTTKRIVACLAKHPLYQFHADDPPRFPAQNQSELDTINSAIADAKTLAAAARLQLPKITATEPQKSKAAVDDIIRAASKGAAILDIDVFEPVYCLQ